MKQQIDEDKATRLAELERELERELESIRDNEELLDESTIELWKVSDQLTAIDRQIKQGSAIPVFPGQPSPEVSATPREGAIGQQSAKTGTIIAPEEDQLRVAMADRSRAELDQRSILDEESGVASNAIRKANERMNQVHRRSSALSQSIVELTDRIDSMTANVQSIREEVEMLREDIGIPIGAGLNSPTRIAAKPLGSRPVSEAVDQEIQRTRMRENRMREDRERLSEEEARRLRERRQRELREDFIRRKEAKTKKTASQGIKF